MKRLSIIVPLFNEADGARPLLRRLYDAMAPLAEVEFRFVLVDDASTDDTPAVLAELAAADPRIRVVSQLRNMGHQHAIMAGLEVADGDAFLMMDGDGQHPPEIAARMVSLWLENPKIDIVQGIRQSGQSAFKERTARWFYDVVRMLIPEARLTPGAADFRVITRRVRTTMLSRPECRRNIRVFLSLYRFPTLTLPFVCEARMAGQSKYSLRKMIRLASDGIFAYTHLPLRLNLLIALTLMAFGLAFLSYTLVVQWLGIAVSGWPSVVGLICLLFSGVFVMLAVLSEYIIMIHENVQDALSRQVGDAGQAGKDT